MRFWLFFAVALGAAGCEYDGGGAPEHDAGVVDATLGDAQDVDASTIDAAPVDAATADAGPLGARAYFEQHVAPVMAARCDGCHARGEDDAPAFGVGYEDLIDFSGERGVLAGCTLTESLLFTEGEHTGPAFSSAEYVHVRAFLELEAGERQACEETLGDRPRSGPLPVREGHYALDLSVSGVGLGGARLDFDLELVDEGIVLSDIVVQSGPAGLVIVGPRFETCVSGVHPELADLRLDLAPNTTQVLGDGSITLMGSGRDDNLGLSFDALLPLAGAMSSPTDAGEVCPERPERPE
jgi:hypothetical protein